MNNQNFYHNKTCTISKYEFHNQTLMNFINNLDTTQDNQFNLYQRQISDPLKWISLFKQWHLNHIKLKLSNFFNHKDLTVERKNLLL